MRVSCMRDETFTLSARYGTAVLPDFVATMSFARLLFILVRCALHRACDLRIDCTTLAHTCRSPVSCTMPLSTFDTLPDVTKKTLPNKPPPCFPCREP